MDDYILRTGTVNGYTVNVTHDETPESPRSWSNLGIMVCRHRRYTLGDSQIADYYLNRNGDSIGIDSKASFQEWQEELSGDKIALILPIFMYEHGGISLSTSSYGDKWDSGQVGYIFATRTQIKNEYNVKNITKKTLELVSEVLTAEVEVYGKYVNGSCYHYEVMDGSETVDSCGGYYDVDEAFDCGTQTAKVFAEAKEYKPYKLSNKQKKLILAILQKKVSVESQPTEVYQEIIDRLLP